MPKGIASVWVQPYEKKSRRTRGSRLIFVWRKSMEYRKYGDTYYVRMDRGDEIIENLLDLCRKEQIASCTYSGIGGCERV